MRKNLAIFVSELLKVRKAQIISAAKLSLNRYQQLIISQLQSISQIDIRKFLIQWQR